MKSSNAKNPISWCSRAFDGYLTYAILSIALPSCYFAQFVCHILFYAETLFRWQLIHKRLELLNVIKSSPFMQALPHCSQELGFGMSRSVIWNELQ